MECSERHFHEEDGAVDYTTGHSLHTICLLHALTALLSMHGMPFFCTLSHLILCALFQTSVNPVRFPCSPTARNFYWVGQQQEDKRQGGGDVTSQ